MLIGTIQINKAEFPMLFKIVLDYLPIQASSVPCERVFSSAKETNTLKRNCIHPVLMEALQTLKFLLKKERFNFTCGVTTLQGHLMTSLWRCLAALRDDTKLYGLGVVWSGEKCLATISRTSSCYGGLPLRV